VSRSLGPVVLLLSLVFFNPTVIPAQVVGQNRNVGAGKIDQFVGDLFLQRQNEPAVAISTRNPDHIFTAFNDYSTVDFAGDPNLEPPAEAWIGVSFSYNRGKSWSHTLVPGFAQDQSPAGLASPLHGLPAGSDPVIASAPNGRIYLGGLFFDRNGISNIAVTRYVDVNKFESGHNFRYEGTTIAGNGAVSPKGAFTDKPSIAADKTRGGAVCGNVYITYSVFDGVEANGNFRSKIMLARSQDCGATFGMPFKLNGNFTRNQGTQMVIEPATGNVYVTWRTFAPDQVLFVKSTNLGATFSTPKIIHEGTLNGYEQNTLSPFTNPSGDFTFRTEAFPAMAVDAAGRIYVAWQERVGNNGLPSANGLPRILLTTSTDAGNTWSQRRAVEFGNNSAHQVMPWMSFSAGVLRLVFYDVRAQELGLDGTTNQLSGINRLVDVRYAESNLSTFQNGNPQFSPSVQVTQYPAGKNNPPNLPMYRGGTVPFFGDYIGIANLPFIHDASTGTWRHTIQTTDHAARPSAAVWTDNRDVIIPADFDFTKYDPPGTGKVSCVNPGSRNANVYFAEVSPGMVAGSPTNFKKLVKTTGEKLQRSFVVYVENNTAITRFFKLTIVETGDANGSFQQFSDLNTMDLQILPQSSVTRAVYVSSTTDATAPVNVSVAEISGLGGGVVGSGLNSVVALNNDPTTAPISSDTEVHTPQVTNPQVTNPQVTNTTETDITWQVTNVGNTTSAYTSLVDVENAQQLKNNGYQFKVSLRKIYRVPSLVPACTTVETAQELPISTIANPQVTNPQVTNPQVTNPQVTNPQVTNSSYYLAPSDSGTNSLSTASSPTGSDGTTVAPLVPDAIVLTLRVTQTKKGGPAFDPKKNKVTHFIYAHSANTDATEGEIVSNSTK
jgi:hypothetical protein